ncbi:putative bifunctional diguanylate cyclase/phosphodiesterase [Hoeflea marina]|uniref:putative bifunctional diguanylate cyclase/phosphodiesterase n=1 Tax=Hoeflea marina TaxID=274592 RepID=UPI001304BAA6|nr:EAL domain-containing protein [Hoeflea marina]
MATCAVWGAALASPLLLGGMFALAGRAQSRLRAELQSERAGTDQLRHTAYHDAVTGLRNRHALSEDVSAIMAAGLDLERRPAMLLLDLDRFKVINDTMGHHAGDEVLLAITRRLKAHCGESRSVYRLGGDEFVIIWDGAPGRGEVEEFVLALQAAVFRPVRHAGAEIDTSGSIGIAFMTPADETVSTVLKRADLALYQAKETSGPSHCFFTLDMDEDLQLRRQFEHSMRMALAGDGFRLDYRPVADAVSLDTRLYEACLRWTHPEHGDVAPTLFLPLAREAGLITQIDRWMLRKAISDASMWPEDIAVLIPVSTRKLIKPGFSEQIRRLLAEFDVAPERLTLSVTSDALGAGFAPLAQPAIDGLRGLGVSVSVSGFGLGEINLAALQEAGVDEVRIDMEQMRQFAGEGREENLLQLLVGFAGSLGAGVTLEGIDTEADLAAARRLGVARFQGGAAGVPLPAMQVGLTRRLVPLNGSRIGGMPRLRLAVSC